MSTLVVSHAKTCGICHSMTCTHIPAFDRGVVGGGSVRWVGSSIVAQSCPGCGMAYLTSTVDRMHPHDFRECAAYRRGFEAGKASKEGP